MKILFWFIGLSLVFGIYLRLLFEGLSVQMVIVISVGLALLLASAVGIVKRTSRKDLDMDIPHKYWLPDKTITLNFTDQPVDLIGRIAAEVSKNDSWTVDHIDAENGLLDLSTRPIIWRYSTIQAKHVRVTCDAATKRVTITSSSQQNKKSLFRELVDYGKDYHNVQYIKRIIESRK